MQLKKTILLVIAFYFAVVISIFISCENNKAVIAQENRHHVIDQVTKSLKNYHAEIKNEGLLAEFKFLDSSSDFFWTPPGFSHSISFDSVSKILKANAGAFNTIDNKWESLKVIPVSDDVATYSGRIHSTMVSKANVISEIRLIETGVLIKRNGKWKLLCGQTSQLP